MGQTVSREKVATKFVRVGDVIKWGSVWFEVYAIDEYPATREFKMRAPGWPEYKTVKRLDTLVVRGCGVEAGDV